MATLKHDPAHRTWQKLVIPGELKSLNEFIMPQAQQIHRQPDENRPRPSTAPSMPNASSSQLHSL